MEGGPNLLLLCALRKLTQAHTGGDRLRRAQGSPSLGLDATHPNHLPHTKIAQTARSRPPGYVAPGAHYHDAAATGQLRAGLAPPNTWSHLGLQAPHSVPSGARPAFTSLSRSR
jgi:hypothetical protein